MTRKTGRGLRHVLAFAVVLITALPRAAIPQNEAVQPDVEELRQQVAELSNLAVRTQSHIMVDVEYHFANLWFAARNAQWDLASFYMRETASHLAWTVRVRPVRSIRGGGSVDLQPFEQSIRQSGFAQLETALEKQDVGEFEAAYRQTMTQCYACHQAAGLGYLEPHVPDGPLSSLMLRPQ